MNWGLALNMLKHGDKVRRAGWNGKGMYVFLFSKSQFAIKIDESATDFPLNDESATGIEHIGFEDEDGNFLPICDFLLLKSAGNNCIPWVTSQADVMADDWEAV